MTDSAQSPAELFKVGGTLKLNTPSYVTRPADEELFEQVLARQFCYVLTSRQMGKSSLMVRTAERLRQQGIETANVDLSGRTDEITSEQWYLGILTRISQNLTLQTDVEQWWRSHSGLPDVQRFTDFLHDVVLAERAAPVVIFIDEIDSTLKLPFTDDFFAAIRFIYNSRATQPEYNRLTFVLLGVAIPTDLIQDRSKTPFNIGRAIQLQEFSRTDAQPLRAGLEQLYPGEGDLILDRIFYWTNGHPYLTQKLCRAVAEAETKTWSSTTVDQLVDRLFFQPTAQKENNLQYVRSNIRENPDQRRLVQLYKKVYYHNAIREDERSLLQNRLRLIGLVRIENHTLQVRNRIYRAVFDDIWIKENLPPNWTQRITFGAVAVLVITIIFLVYFLPSQRQQERDTRIQTFTERFQRSGDPDIRLNSLAGLCEMEAQPQAQALFLQLGQPDRVTMFQKVKVHGANERLGRAVECLYPTVSSITDVEQRTELTTAMCCALHRWNQHDGEQFARRLGFSCDCGNGVDDDDE